MFFIKQSTSQTVRIGPFLDDDDGISQATGLTIDQADVRLSKNGGAFAQSNDAGGGTHDEAGWYYLTLDATDTNTLGMLVVAVHITDSAASALPVWAEFMVLPANVYDSLFAGTDYLQTDVQQVEGSDATDQIRDAVVDDAQRIDASALNTLSGHDPGSQIAAQTDVTGLNDPTATDVADAVWDEARADHVGVGSFGEGVKVESLNTQAKADVNAEADTALTDYDPPTKTEMDNKIDALNDISADDVHDEVVEGTVTFRQAVRIILSVFSGKSSGGGTSTITFRDIGDTKNRVSCTVDANGNRTAVGTRDGT